ncbi:RRM domain-containing protein [Haematococcus lacustris]|uniref:RRM domain-containing protein n=1 Tax=Haematococcus lacustris TaxID=44745 RepID=A0A699ZFG1_HAELA|nr:RRM domain-containing protein [Haematococcus lacustris]
MGAATKHQPDNSQDFIPLNTDAAPQPAKRKKPAPAAAVGSDSEPSTSSSSRVVYIGNLPHGFYEKELLGFFSQFGKLTRVRLSRSKKTGKAKHYAFLEFQHPEVAEIAAGANQRFRTVQWRAVERRRHDKERSPQEHAVRVARLIKRDAQRAARIKAAGIDYEYTPVKQQVPPKPKRTVIEMTD